MKSEADEWPSTARAVRREKLGNRELVVGAAIALVQKLLHQYIRLHDQRLKELAGSRVPGIQLFARGLGEFSFGDPPLDLSGGVLGDLYARFDDLEGRGDDNDSVTL